MEEIKYADIPEYINISGSKICNLTLIDVNFKNSHIPFVFDTGAMITVISKSMAESIGAHITDETMKGGGNAGGVIHGNTAIIDSMYIGHSEISNKKAAVLPDEALDFGTDDDGNHIVVNGFLGWDIIKNFKWTIDSTANTILIEKPVKSDLEANMDYDNMPIIYANYNDDSICLGFDSGNTESTLGKFFVPSHSNASQKTDTITGVDGKLKENVFVKDHIEFKIGKQAVNLKNISAVNRDIFPAKRLKPFGLLASDIVENRTWSIDYFNRHFEIIK